MTTRYTKDHEWIRLDGDIATVGISDYAQSQLGDVVFVDLPAKGKPKGDGMVCDGKVVNCGRNYEGLCLLPDRGSAPTTKPPCIGFAAGKQDGRLYCVTEERGRLVVHHAPAIEIAGHESLADCAFDNHGGLWAGSNMFDLGRVYRVIDWQTPERADVQRVAALALGFPETLAVRDDIVYRMSDMGGSPSLMARYRCPASAPAR